MDVDGQEVSRSRRIFDGQEMCAFWYYATIMLSAFPVSREKLGRSGRLEHT